MKLALSPVGFLGTLLTAAMAIAPIPQVTFILQIATASALAGSAVALRAHHRNPHANTWRITTAWGP